MIDWLDPAEATVRRPPSQMSQTDGHRSKRYPARSRRWARATERPVSLKPWGTMILAGPARIDRASKRRIYHAIIFRTIRWINRKAVIACLLTLPAAGFRWQAEGRRVRILQGSDAVEIQAIAPNIVRIHLQPNRTDDAAHPGDGSVASADRPMACGSRRTGRCRR